MSVAYVTAEREVFEKSIGTFCYVTVTPLLPIGDKGNNQLDTQTIFA